MTRAGAAAVLAIVAAAGGCAGVRAQRERQQRLAGALDAQRYARPVAEVWLEARRLLAAEGYPLAEEDAKEVGQRPMGLASSLLSPARATHPLAAERGLLQELGVLRRDEGGPRGLALDTGWSRELRRQRAEAFEGDGGVRVVFTRIQQLATDRQEERSRDLELELALLRRLEPAAAAQVEESLPR